jgi:hypothetical protein
MEPVIVPVVVAEVIVVVFPVRFVALDVFVARAAVHCSLARRTHDGSTNRADGGPDWTSSDPANDAAGYRAGGRRAARGRVRLARIITLDDHVFVSLFHCVYLHYESAADGASEQHHFAASVPLLLAASGGQVCCIAWKAELEHGIMCHTSASRGARRSTAGNLYRATTIGLACASAVRQVAPHRRTVEPRLSDTLERHAKALASTPAPDDVDQSVPTRR